MRSRNLLGHLYFGAFLFYLFVPLIIMGGAAFNDNRLPSIYPWKGWTDRWFIELFNDQVMWNSFINTMLVALAVVVIAVPLGTAGAILINSISGKVRGAALRRHGCADPDARRRHRHLDAAVLEPDQCPHGPASVGTRTGQLHRSIRDASGAGAAAELRPGAGGGGARPRRQAMAR